MPPAGRPTNCEPSVAGRSWKGGARERADDVFFTSGIKRRRSKADFAPTWDIETVWMPQLSGLHPKPNRSPAQRVRFGKEEQQNERALTYKISRSKRYDACSDVVEAGGVEPPSENVLTGTSPGADGLLRFPSQSASRHALRVGSFMVHGALKALRTHGPH